MRLGGAWLEALLFGFAALFLAGGFGLTPVGQPGFELEGRTPTSFRVVTWNVGSRGGSGGRPLDEQAVEHVAEVIAALEPDLIFLQELRSRGQLEDLLTFLGDDWRTAISRPGDRRVAALAPRGKLEVRPAAGEARRSLAVELELEGGQSVLALAIHAHAWSSAERNEEVGSAVDELLGMPGPWVRMLVGDLNLDLDLDKRGDLFSDDAHRDVETYNYVADRLLDVGRGAGFTAEPDRRLDYIFVTQDIPRVVQAGPWRGRRLGGMDHEPLVADLEVE